MNIINKLQNWLLKRTSCEDSALVTSRRIYILPTKEGIMFAIFIFLMLSAAINFNNSLVFFCTFLMVGIGIISMHMTQQNLLNLQFSIAHVKPVFCFQHLSFPLVICQSSNNVNLNTLSKYSIAINFSNQKKSEQLQFVDVSAHEKSQLLLSTATIKRGQFDLPPLTISTHYPLGLFRAWTNIQLNNDAIVYPKPAQKFLHNPESGSNTDDMGANGRGFDDFSGFKSYQTGEPLTHIHWKAYAREQGLLSKIFSGGSSSEYWLNWNELSGDIESRLSQLCRLIIDAENQGDRYGLKLPGNIISISQGQQQQQQCLKMLALFRVDYA